MVSFNFLFKLPISTHIAIGTIVTLVIGLIICLVFLKKVRKKLNKSEIQRHNLELSKLHLTNDLFAQKEHLRILLSTMMDSVITTDAQGFITYMNPEAEKITGFSFESIKNQTCNRVFTLIDQNNQMISCPLLQCLANKKVPSSLQYGLLLNRDKNKFDIQYALSLLHDKNGQLVGAEIVFQNITQAKTLQDELRYNAVHDTLTGLLNRREFEKVLTDAVKNFKSKGISYILCYLDLDFFKLINNAAGHTAGDFLLQEVANVMQKRLRKTDVLARLAGDEFGALLLNSSLTTGKKICQELIEEVNAIRFHWNDKIYRVGMSVGMVLLSNPERSASQLLSDADIACYAAKTEGRNQIFVFESEKTQYGYNRDMLMISNIQEAIEHNRMIFFIQKIVSTDPDKPQNPYFEILVRLIGEDNKIIEASNFVEIAERFNLMLNVDRWILSQILEHYDKSLAKLDSAVFSINLSANSLNDFNFLPFLLGLIKKSYLPPQRLCFEITETAAMNHITKTIEIVNKLQEIGCKIALDDFGVGLSSFSYVKNFSVNYIKIDGSFVKNVETKEVDRTIVQTINEMAHRLNMKTVAEYVESPEILKAITEIGVDFAQGYAIGEPMPLSKLIRDL